MNNEQVSTIDLQELFQTIFKNIILVIFITALFTLGAFIFTKYGISEKFESKTLIALITNNVENNQTSDQFRRSVELAKRYSVLSKSEAVLKEVQKDVQDAHDITLTTKQLGDYFTVTSVNDTDILRITVTYTDKEIAKTIAQSVTDHSKIEYTKAYLTDNVVIIDNAEVINTAVSPNIMLNTVIGFVLGSMISIGIILMKEFLNRKIKTQKDIEQYLGIPYFGAIPDRKYLK